MAYTSIIPVSRLDNSITYIRNKDKTTKKGQSAGSLEEAIYYAMNRDKTERSVFEDAIGCVCETAYQDMVATKKRYHKMDGVQGYHLVQSFVKGEVTPELAHQIGMEMAERLLQGKYEAVITTHLNTEHYHNHIVFNSVSMEDGKSTTATAGVTMRMCGSFGCLMPEIRLICHRTEKRQREILCTVDGRTGRKADLENLDPSGHPGCCGRELHMETVSGTDEAEGIPVEAEPEVHCIKSTGDGTVYPSAEPWEALLWKRASGSGSCSPRAGYLLEKKEIPDSRKRS